MTDRLARLVERTTTGYTLAWSLGAILIGLLIYPHASVNWVGAFVLFGLAGLLGLWPRRLAPERQTRLRSLNALANLANLAGLALVVLQALGKVLYHF